MQMFVQVIQGRVSDPTEFRAALDRWLSDLAPGATGWLGSTSGVTPDGIMVALARFESEQAARRNSDRPEQGQWWSDTAKLFAEEPTFRDSVEVVTGMRGGSDDAGFVQIIQGRATNLQRLRELTEQADKVLADLRPDVVGGLVALHGDGTFTQAMYFTSEAAAREGERKEPPAEFKPLMDEQMSLVSDVTFYDLPDPWLHSPK
jgi:hypothetical protein